MKKILVSILIGVMFISSLPVSAASFTDVKQGDWYYSQVMAMTEKGLFKGKGNNLFCPDDTMTRAEFITVVVRALYPNADISSDTGEKWWQGAYEVALEKGILEDDEFITYNSAENELIFYSGTNLSTDNNIPLHTIELDVAMQRQEMALISVRALNTMGETDIKEYEYIPDIHKASIIYRDDVSKAYGAGIIVGDETGKFNPKNTLTRAEASTVLYRIIEKSARAEVKFDLSGPITIYEGQYRTNRNAKEGDTFVKKDGTQIVLKKGPNGILGEGQGVAPDVGLNLGLYTVQGDGGNFSYNAEKHGKMVDSTGVSIQNQRYSVHAVTGEGHWGHEWTAIGKAYPKPTYEGTYNGETSKDAYQLWVWMDGMWVENLG